MAESTHWCQGGMRKWDSSDGYVICPCCSKKWVCLCVSWIRDLHPKQNISKFHENSKIGFWDCNQFMRTCKQYKATSKKTIKTLKTLLCESLKISAHSEIKITSSHIKQAIVCPNRTPAPVSSMLPDRFCTNVSALRIRFSPLKYKAKVINLPMTMSAIKFDKCQVAATLSLIYTVRLGKTCCSQCVATRGYSPFPFSDVFCYVMESFKMYQDVIQHGEVDSTWKSKTAFGWISRSVTHWDIHIAWVLQCGEVCGRSAATGDILVAFLCSLRCLVDWGAKLYKPIGVRFIGSNSCHKSVACMSLKHQESIRRYFTSVSHLIRPNFHPLALHLSKKKCSTTYATWVCTSSARANQQHWPTIYYFPCIPHDLSWSNVRCMTVLTVWWCPFSIIEAMLCIGSGWSAVGWTGTLHLVTHTQSKFIKVVVTIVTNRLFTAAKRPTIEGNCRTGGVGGAFVMVTTLDHAALTAGLWLTFFLICSLWAKMQISSDYQDPHGLLIDRLQWLYCRCPCGGWLRRLGLWKQELRKRNQDEWMNGWMNEWINPSIDQSINQPINKSIQVRSISIPAHQEWCWGDCWISPIACRIRHLGTSFRQEKPNI